ncbi:hypothetical protein E0L93_06370 [Rubrobacter taiwanensis]|uniref:DUF624 domain-containing protein n=1 Tax=Rubrobacter taiwanensis TaxID=185139 RepID=A0A4R1BLU8_9ACTN|nr:hypothetical protein [Rubrobacter taiwanensis]TCJ18359.1 hypothetical protein E0L93_06370 [Rubrobacter taiwanensis]
MEDWRESFTVVALSRIWDRLGTVLWTGLLSFPLGLTVLLLPPALAAVADAAVRGVRDEEFGLRDFFASGLRYFLRSWVIFLLLVFIFAAILFNVQFYAAREGIFWTAALSLTLALAFIVTVVAPFLFPALVRDDLGLRDTVRYATLAALRKPLNAVSVALIAGSLLLLLTFTTVGLLFFWPVTMFFAAAALERAVKEHRAGPTPSRP